MFSAFQRREVTKLAKEFVDIVHEYGKEAMMFLRRSTGSAWSRLWMSLSP
ncbi:MAG: 1,3-beta-galactosyl-N-acetylhexosamine phosphorylase N-terminal domain-containing protein [Coprococcus sp.]